MRYRIVLDTNVVLSALRSRSGASAALLRRLASNAMSGSEEFTVCLSVTLALEYEEILQRYRADFGWDEAQVKRFLAGLYDLVEETPVYFRWRPFLRDADDDMVLEAALSGGCTTIVTFNRRDFVGIESLNLEVITPSEFLQRLQNDAEPAE